MIEIVDYHKFTPREGQVSYLKGFIKLKMKTDFGWLECRDLQLFSKNGHHWVNFPSKVVENPEGKRYVYFMHFDKEANDKFSETVINALKSWKKPNTSNDTNQPPMSQPSASNGPRNGIPETKTVPISMDPVMKMQSSQGTVDDLPF